MASHGFPLLPLSSIDWQNLAFDPINVNGHIQCTYSHKTGEWSEPTFLRDPYLSVHGLAPALNYGQQIFEGMKAFRTPTGRVQLFRPTLNATRFAHSARVVGIPPIPKDTFLHAVRLAVALNSEFVPPHDISGASLYIRPVAFASGAGVNLTLPAKHFTFCVFVIPVGPLPASTSAGKGLRALVVEDMDRTAPKGTGSAKIGGNYGPTMTVIHNAKAKGYGLTLHLDSATRTLIHEFSASAFIGVRSKDGKTTVVVVDGPSILKSVTVDSLCQIAESFGWNVEKRAVLFAELADLSEAFAVGTAYILTPIRSITRESTSDSIEYTADYQSSTSAYACLLNALRGIQEGRVHDAWGWTEEIQNATSNIPTNLPCDNPIIECLNMANEAFWRQYLAGCEGTVFPQIPATVRQVRCIGKADYRISLADGIAEKSHSVIASVIQTSWALLVGQYTESQDVIIKSCNIPQNGTIDDAFAIPIRFKVCKDRFTGELSQHADELTRIVLSKQVDPPGAHTEKWTSCLAQNPPVLVQLHGEAVDLSPEAFHTGQVNSTDCGLLLHCVVFKDEIRIRAHFDPQVIDPQQTQRLLYQLSHVMKQVCRPDIRVGDIDFLSSNDRQEIASWNSGVGPSNACIHTLISHQVQRCPQAPAVSASDGDLTYRELENHANRLAAHLVRLGIRPGNFVPTLFEKSMWTQVAVLAILKTGAAFVMLDPAHPASRNRLICQKVGSQIVVASPRLEKALCGEGAVPRVVTLSQDLMAGLPALDVSEHELLPSPNPYTGAYVLFTSGSTGQPKGALLEHRSFSAAARSVIAITGITPTTRVLQFSSYSFGAALIEMLATLIAGGCVCVPTDAERFSGSIADVIATHRVNWAFMTPSMARTLDPTSIRLQTLVTGGESVTPELVHAWAPHVDVFTVYGSAEQSTMAALGGPLLASESGARVGRPFSGCYAWIVDPDDVNRLAPVGCVGELVLEGALVARGYLDEPDKNVTAFPDGCRLAWRSGFAPHPDGPGQTRFYRTGDLLRYKGKDGTLEFVARRDGYVKLRGQRIELGEVEFQLMEAMKVPSELCVEIIVPKGATSLDQAALMAFIVLGDAYDGEDVESGDELIPSLKNRTLAAERLGSDVETRLANTLPAHMVPHFFFPLRRLPLTVSGKIVRKALRARAGRLSSQQLAELSLNRAAVRKEPTSELELYLQSVWAQLLVVPVSTISVDDSFFQVGGDSIKAIKLFRRLRADGYDLDVPGILASPVLSQMALKCQSRKS